MDAFEEFQNELAEAGVTEGALQSSSEEIIGRLGELIEDKFKLENDIAELTGKLKEKEAELQEYDRVKIPELIEAAGLSEVTTKTGHKITIKEEYRGNITEANSDIALEWFIKSGGADTIKNNYVIPVSINDKQVAEKLEEILNAVGLGFSRKIGIAWNTLAGVIKELDTTNTLDNNEVFEQLKKENNLDPELTLKQVLGAFKYKNTKVKAPKAKK